MAKGLRALLVGALLLAINACGGSNTERGGFGRFRIDVDGAVATYLIPAPLNDARVAELDRLRVQLQAPPPGYYVTVMVDNRQGESAFAAGAIRLRSATGGLLTTQPAGLLLKQWAEAAPRKKPLKYWFGIAERPRYSGFIEPGHQGEAILVIPNAAAEISSVEYNREGARIQRL